MKLLTGIEISEFWNNSLAAVFCRSTLLYFRIFSNPIQYIK